MTVVLALIEVTETVEPPEGTAGKGATDTAGSWTPDALIAADCETETTVVRLATAATGVTETGLEDRRMLELTGIAAVGVSAAETAPETGAWEATPESDRVSWLAATWACSRANWN